MKEEIKEIEVVDAEVKVTELEPEEDKNGSGAMGKIVLGAIGAGIVILGVKGRKKLKAWGDKRAIKRIEKAGGTVIIPCDDIVEEENSNEDVQ